MKLLLKFNLIFLLVFVLGLAAASLIARGLLQKVATEEVVDRARLLMEKANAVSTYTATQIKPLQAMASICNDDWASLSVMSGHERKTLRLSAQADGRWVR